MKKIKSIEQLKAEKKRIKQRQTELENKIHVNWKELKEQLSPVNMAKDNIISILRKKVPPVQGDGGLVKSALSYGITLLAEKLAEKADEKLSKIFRKQPVSGEQAS
jgi:hypothetical protein